MNLKLVTLFLRDTPPNLQSLYNQVLPLSAKIYILATSTVSLNQGRYIMPVISQKNLPAHPLVNQAFSQQQTVDTGMQIIDNTSYHEASQQPPTKYIAPQLQAHMAISSETASGINDFVPPYL